MSETRLEYAARRSRLAARELLAKFLGIKQLPAFAVVHHIDGNPFNNTISNLQLVTKEEHAKIHSGKDQRYGRKITEGRVLPKGVTYDPRRKNFHCGIRVGPTRYQCRVKTLEEAIQWRRFMEETYWKD